MSFNIWKQIKNMMDEEKRNQLRERAFLSAAAGRLDTGTEGTALDYYEGDIDAAAKAMGIDLGAEMQKLER